MNHPEPTRILLHRPDLVGKPRPPRPAAEPLKAKPTPPPVVYQVATVLSATARWLKAGRPNRSPEQLAEVKAICKTCPFWNPEAWLGKGRCMKCGCSGIKLEWATESCPDRPPRWLATHVDT
jgi:hypothetical protein